MLVLTITVMIVQAAPAKFSHVYLPENPDQYRVFRNMSRIPTKKAVDFSILFLQDLSLTLASPKAINLYMHPI